MSGRMLKAAVTAFSLAICAVSPAVSQGIFDKTADWGPRTTNKVAGSVSVTGSGASAIYNLAGNGDDIWNNDDEGFYVYTEKEGSWSLSGKFTWVDPGADPWAKMGPMIRVDGAARGSVNFFNAARGQKDLISPQWRNAADAGSGSHGRRIRDDAQNMVALPDGEIWLRIARYAPLQLQFMEWSRDGQNWELGYARVFTMPEKVAYGLAITNHLDNTLLATATVGNVELNQIPTIGMRSIKSGIKAGESVVVTINLHTPTATTIKETLPSGWTASNISNGGTANGNVITWNTTATTNSVSYTATAPASLNDVAQLRFKGSVAGYSTLGEEYLTLVQPGIGAFEGVADVGTAALPGYSTHNGGEYVLAGGGGDVEVAYDTMHFVYRKMSGAFSIKGSGFLYPLNGNATWAKGGLMIRDSLDSASANAFMHLRSDLQMRAQFRPATHDFTGNAGLTADQAGVMELVRNGNVVEMYRYNNAGNRTLVRRVAFQNLSDPVFVGIAVTSNHATELSELEMSDVVIQQLPMQVYRNVSSNEIAPGGSISVTVHADIREGQTANLNIVENISSGGQVMNVQASAGTATLGNGSITWTGSNITGNQTLSYDIVHAPNTGGMTTLTGTYSDGKGTQGNLMENRIYAFDFSGNNLGVFTGHRDVGAVAASGKVGRAGNHYAVVGSGADIWGTADEMHYLYFQTSGDFIVTVENAHIGPYGSAPSANDWQKVGIMARQNLEAGSTYAFSMLRSLDQNLYLQWRDPGVTAAGAPDAEIVNVSNHKGNIGLERKGNDFISFYTDSTGTRVDQSLHSLPMTDPIYLGIATTSHQDGSHSIGVVHNLKINGVSLPIGEWMLH